MKLELVHPSVSSSAASAAVIDLTVEDLMQQVSYRANKVFNLEPQSLLTPTEREALSAELAPAIARIRTALVKQRNRIIEAFSEKSNLRHSQFPADGPLDYAMAGYSDLERDLEDTFIETLDLEQLIAKGVPVVIVKARLRQIRANLRVVIAVLNVSLVKIQWRELEENATSTRNYRLPFAERTDVGQSQQSQRGVK
jgi:hypothetical protein